MAVAASMLGVPVNDQNHPDRDPVRSPPPVEDPTLGALEGRLKTSRDHPSQSTSGRRGRCRPPLPGGHGSRS
jgi:hypothetical protein